MAQYNTGTVTVTKGSAIVTGSGTDFINNVSAGDLFKLEGIGVFKEIESVDSATQITLSSAWAGDSYSNATYSIHKDFTPNYKIPKVNFGDWDIHAVITDAINKIDRYLAGALVEWIEEEASPSYVSSTSFTLAGDKTDIYIEDRRLKLIISSNTYYNRVVSSSYSSPNTTVVVETANLTSGLSKVYYGYLQNLPNNVIKDTHIDWGSGENQVSDEDIPIKDPNNNFSGEILSAVLDELLTEIKARTGIFTLDFSRLDSSAYLMSGEA